jgi:hypothetical protein
MRTLVGSLTRYPELEPHSDRDMHSVPCVVERL